MKHKKNAQVSTQFNWIFILVVGGLILSMFVAFSTKQTEIAEVQIDARSLEGITTIFESARTGTALSTEIETMPIEMTFTCESDYNSNIDEEAGFESGGYVYSDYSVNSLRKKIPGLVVFAPQTLSGKNLITWTYPWDFPYRVMNFFYVTNPRTRYYFVLNDAKYTPLFDLVNDSFSGNIVTDFIRYPSETLSEIVDLNDDLTIIVLFSDDITSDQIEFKAKEFENEVRFVKVSPGPGGEQVPPRSYNALFGDVTFFSEKSVNGLVDIFEDSSSYYNLASLFGAIISADQKYYDCTMQKASQRLNRIACIYSQKYHSLYVKTTDPECKNIYQTAERIIGEYFNLDSSLDNEELPDRFCDFSNNVLKLYIEGSIKLVIDDGYIDELKFFKSLSNLNKNAIGESCAPLY